jgi:hypothetical protein
MFTTTLKWPVISLLIIGAVHFLAEAALPELSTVFVPAVVGPVLLAFGIGVGLRIVQSGGHLGHAMLAGAIVGLLPAALDIVGFGLALGRGLLAGVLCGVFGFGMVLFGALIGAAFSIGVPKAARA